MLDKRLADKGIQREQDMWLAAPGVDRSALGLETRDLV